MKVVEAAGARFSAVGLGTWQFGSSEWGYGSAYAEGTAPDIVERSLELGVTLFDSAEIYGFGRSERILGAALGDRRSEAFVATKLLPILPIGPVVAHRARASARRLDVDRIDLYQLHWPNPVVPPSVTMPALARLQAAGLIGHVGVSNYSLAQWQAAEQALGGPVLSNQVRYSLVHRTPEAELLGWAQAEGRVVIAYSPLGQGLLSGAYDVEHRPVGWRARTGGFLPENLARLGPLLGVLGEVAAAHGVTRAQVALAWLLRRPQVVVIPGASSVAQAEANAAAAEIELSNDEDQALTAASDAFRPTTGWPAATALARQRVERLAGRVRRAIQGLEA